MHEASKYTGQRVRLKEVWMKAGGRGQFRGRGPYNSQSAVTCAVGSVNAQRGGENGPLTLDPLQLGAPEGHGQVEGDEVLVVAHRHQEVELHLRQHLSKQTRA